MSSIPPIQTTELLHKYGLRPNKGLGQNFLQDPAILEKIASVAEIQPNDSVLEIGPGLGSLTRHLAAAARAVTAIELDSQLIPVLHEVLAPWPNTRIVEGDILNIPPARLVDSDDYLVVANVPYYITSAIFRHLLEAAPRPRRIVLTIQKEVARRICARPGEMSLLALSVQVYGLPTIAATLPAGAFYPPPKVDSAVIRVDVSARSAIPAELLGNFFHLIKAGFSQKRKTLRNSLSAGLRLSPAEAASLLETGNIDPQRRAETLSMEEWGRLAAIYKK